MKISIVNPWSWYPVAASQDLAAGAVMPILLHGEKLVAWRAEDGRPAVWNDRCPHRGMSLALGATIGERLVCPYHGWEFAIDGACRRIPAHPDVTPSRAARTRVYPAIEADNYLWACLGEPATQQPAALPHAGLRRHPVRSMHIAADAETVALALLLQPPGYENLQAAAWDISDRGVTMDYDGRRGLHSRLDYPAQIATDDPNGDGPRTLILLQPTGEATTCVHLALAGGAPSLAARQALNQSLVRFRLSLPTLIRGESFARLRAQTAALTPSQEA